MATTTTEQSTMIAVFADRERANLAIDNLRHAGYSYDQIRLVERGSNSFVENIKSLFTGQSTATTDSPDDWMKIGIPEQDARNYQSEIDAGRSIVLLKSVPNPEQALSIMRQSGAYDIVIRLRTAQPAMAAATANPNAQAGPYNSNAQAGTSNPNVPPPAYNPNVPPPAYHPNAQPGTYDTQPQPRATNPPGDQDA